MADALADFKRKTIAIQIDGGTRMVAALVKPPFAIHALQSADGPNEWIRVVSHLPTGMSLSSAYMVFDTDEHAAAAVLAIENLTNWNFTRSERSVADMKALRNKVCEIAKRFGGRPTMGTGVDKADDRLRLNGYERPAA